MNEKNHKIEKKRSLYINTFRVIASILLLYLVYKHFYSDLRFNELQKEFSEIIRASSILPLLCIILLMPLNWFLESMKWRVCLMPYVKLSKVKAFKAVFQGITLGIITPARIGEYGGRILYLAPNHRIPGVLSTLICSLYQNIINILAACSFIVYLGGLPSLTVYNKHLLILGISLSICVFMILLFLPKLIRTVAHVKWIKKRILHFDKLEHQVRSIQQYKVFLYALLRYIIYCIQYWLIFQVFPITTSPIPLWMGISIIYGIQTLLPLTPLLQVGLRGSIALIVLFVSKEEEHVVVLASYALWFINLAIPSILGAILMFFKRKT